MSTTVLITGGNRGLGKGLLERFIKLPNHTIIATVRDPDQSASQDLLELPCAEGTKLVLVKLDLLVWQDAFDAVKTLEAQGIDHLDVVIANAGVSYIWPTVADVKLEDIEGHMRPNAYGLVATYQATRSLLQKSTKEPILAYIGTTAGSVSAPIPFPNAAYGASKATANWYCQRIGIEDEWLNSFSLVPGWVHTDLGDAGAKGLGVSEEMQAQYMIGLDESCDGMMKMLSETSKEKHGGKQVMWNGETTPF